MNVKQKWLMGNKCEDENWRHCCFPWASLLKPVKLTCSFHLFAMSLSIEHVRKLTYICIHAYIGSASQISNFSLFKAIFTICIFFKLDNKMNCLAWKKKKKRTWCTVNELQVIQSRSTTHILCSNHFKYENKVPQVPQRHFRSSPFPVHLPLCPHRPQLIFCLSIAYA